MEFLNLAVSGALNTIAASTDLLALDLNSPIVVQLPTTALATDAIAIYESNIAAIASLAQAQLIATITGQAPLEIGGLRARYLYAIRTAIGVAGALTATIAAQSGITASGIVSSGVATVTGGTGVGITATTGDINETAAAGNITLTGRTVTTAATFVGGAAGNARTSTGATATCNSTATATAGAGTCDRSATGTGGVSTCNDTVTANAGAAQSAKNLAGASCLANVLAASTAGACTATRDMTATGGAASVNDSAVSTTAGATGTKTVQGATTSSANETITGTAAGASADVTVTGGTTATRATAVTANGGAGNANLTVTTTGGAAAANKTVTAATAGNANANTTSSATGGAATATANLTATGLAGAIGQVDITAGGAAAATTSRILLTAQSATAFSIIDLEANLVPGTLGGVSILTGAAGTQAIYVNPTQQVSIGIANADASAMLDVQSTVGGVLFPRMTGAQFNAINTNAPAHALMAFISDQDTTGQAVVNVGTAANPARGIMGTQHGTIQLAAGTTALIPAHVSATSSIIVSVRTMTPGVGNLTVQYSATTAGRAVGESGTGGGFTITALLADGTINVLDTSFVDWIVVG